MSQTTKNIIHTKITTTTTTKTTQSSKDVKSKFQNKPQTRPQPQPQTRTQPKPQTRPQPKPSNKLQAKPPTKLQAKAQPNQQTNEVIELPRAQNVKVRYVYKVTSPINDKKIEKIREGSHQSLDLEQLRKKGALNLKNATITNKCCAADERPITRMPPVSQVFVHCAGVGVKPIDTGDVKSRNLKTQPKPAKTTYQKPATTNPRTQRTQTTTTTTTTTTRKYGQPQAYSKVVKSVAREVSKKVVGKK